MIPRPSRLAAATAVLLALGAAPALADSTGTSSSTDVDRTPAQRPTARPAPVLPREMHGRAAVDALGARLSAVAARNGLSAPRLMKILTEDKTAWLTDEGQMFYREQGAQVEQVTGAGAGSATVPEYPTSQTFKLHSRPGATKQIFLDFDGSEVTKTAWNTGTSPIASATYTGYDSDGVPLTYSTAEHAWMQEVWRQVAETYAPFDVDVTTADGGQAARTRSSTSDNTYGTQVLFTNSAAAVAQACDSTCLGLAYVGTFGDVDPDAFYQPAWVFTTKSMSPTIAAQGASHEAGHTLGLHHDGTATSPYYAGTAAWGPIMGSARTRAVSQFSIGEYPGANNTEDDFAVIQSNGLSLRSDDHGSTLQTADQLGAKSSYAVDGVISTRLDNDVFAVDLQCSTDLTVTATGIGPQTAADLKLDVLNGSGATVMTSSPLSGYAGSPPVSSGMNASVTVPGAIGAYYLRVDGVGNGDPKGTGWSDYGSLGQYRLTANGCADGATQPVDPPTGGGNVDPPPVVTTPSAPRIGTAISGTRGGKITAVARWTPPTSTGGAPITKYRVLARRMDSRGRVVATYTSAFQKPSVRRFTMTLPRKARYRFAVAAWNRVGVSKVSALSNAVNAR